MRISLETLSTTCLLFDNDLDDLLNVLRGNTQRKPIWHNPLVLLLAITKECGRTSEKLRGLRDNEILDAEKETKSTMWDIGSLEAEKKTKSTMRDNGLGKEKQTKSIMFYQKSLVRSDDIYETNRTLQRCNNELTFVNHAVNFEIDVWTFLQQIMKEPWIPKICDKADLQFITDTINYELGHTSSRKAQIACLHDRLKVQIGLVRIHLQLPYPTLIAPQFNNLIADQESSRMRTIAILGLLFVPASLITVSAFLTQPNNINMCLRPG